MTQKGKGYAPAETSSDKYHGVVKFDVATGKQAKAQANAPAYTKVFGESLVKEARKDDKIVAITAAMPGGTGIDIFQKAFPERTFDVGIAEQHGVTFAAGLASEGTSRSPRSTRPSCNAATIRWCTTSRSSGCPCASRSIAPASSAQTARLMPGPSI